MNSRVFINFLVAASFFVATNLCGLRAICCEDTSNTHAHEDGATTHDHSHDEKRGDIPEHHDKSQETCCTNFSAVSSVGIQTKALKVLTKSELPKTQVTLPQVVVFKRQHLREKISGVDPPNLKFLSLLSSLHRAPNAPPVASIRHALSL